MSNGFYRRLAYRIYSMQSRLREPQLSTNQLNSFNRLPGGHSQRNKRQDSNLYDEGGMDSARDSFRAKVTWVALNAMSMDTYRAS